MRVCFAKHLCVVCREIEPVSLDTVTKKRDVDIIRSDWESKSCFYVEISWFYDSPQSATSWQSLWHRQEMGLCFFWPVPCYSVWRLWSPFPFTNFCSISVTQSLVSWFILQCFFCFQRCNLSLCCICSYMQSLRFLTCNLLWSLHLIAATAVCSCLPCLIPEGSTVLRLWIHNAIELECLLKQKASESPEI